MPLPSRDTSGPALTPLDPPARPVTLTRSGTTVSLTCARACSGALLVYRTQAGQLPSRMIPYRLRAGQTRVFSVGAAARVIAVDGSLRRVAR